MGAMVETSWLKRIDAKAGDGLEAVLRSHHRRRLGPPGLVGGTVATGGRSWWATRAPVRSGNHVQVLVDGGREALAAMEAAIKAARVSVHIAGWHVSPDFALTRGPGALPLRDLLADVARRVPVRLLLWAGPPLPLFQPTRTVVRRARDEFVRDSRVQCALDRRERTMHCHHEKIVSSTTRRSSAGSTSPPLQGDRHDASSHPPRASLGWHDAAVHLRGPAVVDVAAHFTRRWNEVTGEQLAPPVEPAAAGNLEVQVLRTVPGEDVPVRARGEFTILEAYLRALRSAERFIYLENQFLWSPEVVDVLADKLSRPPCEDFRILLLLPAKPSNGADTTRGQLGRLLDADAGAGRLLATTITAHHDGRSAPVYVHAKVAIVDDRWLTIGSANLNEHSLLQRHRDERPRVRPRAGAADTAAALVRAHRAPGARGRRRAGRRHRHRVAAHGAGADAAGAGGAAAHAQLALLESVSRRADRLQGPVRGLLVDG